MKKSKNSVTDAQDLRGLASVSMIVFLLDKLSSAIYNAVKNGFFGKIFTAYSKEQLSFEDSYLVNHFTSGSKFKLYFRHIRRFLSSSFETSWFFCKLEQLLRGLTAMPLRTLGNFSFSFGLYVVIIYLLRLFIPSIPEADVSYAITGIIVCISSIPMLLSRDNIASAVGKSVFLGALFSEVFGIRDESFRKRTKVSRAQTNFMMLFGMVLGVLTVFVSPITILITILSLVSVALILFVPEIGVILTIFCLPFLSFFDTPATILGLLVLTAAFSYFIKLIRGKRILKLEIMDLSVVLFAIILYFSGAITAGGREGYNEALISFVLMLGFFLTVNLMRTEKWIKRCVLALVSSGTVVAVIGILQYVLGLLPTGAWLDRDYFYDIKGRAVSLFDNPNVLAAYLILVLPFALYLMAKAPKGRARFLAAFSVLTNLACIVLTWSRGAWIAAILCIFIFLLMYSKKTLRFIFLACLFVPFVPFFIPDSLKRRFLSIGDLADTSTMYRLYTWRGTMSAAQDNFWGGIGYGPAAFREIYPQYAYAGIEAAQHSHNLFLQILLGMGIFGLVAFLVVIVLFYQMNLEFLKETKYESLKLIVVASICAVTATLAMGMVDFVWYNYRIFYLFWVVLALACSCVRIGNEDRRRHEFNNLSEISRASIDYDM